MFKLTKKQKARRTTIAPAGFKENQDNIVIGEVFKQILVFFSYPRDFVEGFLASKVTSPFYSLSMKIEHSDLDEASALKNEINEKQDKYEHSNDPVEQKRLANEIHSLNQHIERLINSSNATLNVMVQATVSSTSKEELYKIVKDMKNDFSASSTQIKLRGIRYIQSGLYKNQSPLFIDSGLRKEVAYSNGQLMSSLSCAALWPFIFDTLEDPQGTLIGRELTNGGKILFNQFLYKDYPDQAKQQGRSNGNMIVVGRSGTGKTTLMNLILMGHIINHRKIIWIDPENKNRNLCSFIKGNYVEIGLNNQIINMLDLKPISTDSDTRESKKAMYDTQNAIFNVCEEIKITFETLWPNISEDALAMIGEITVETYKSVGIDGYESFEHLKPEDYPTFADFTHVIKDKIEIYSRQEELYHREIDALKELEMKMRQITGSQGINGEWGRYFNGITTIKKRNT